MVAAVKGVAHAPFSPGNGLVPAKAAFNSCDCLGLLFRDGSAPFASSIATTSALFAHTAAINGIKVAPAGDCTAAKSGSTSACSDAVELERGAAGRVAFPSKDAPAPVSTEITSRRPATAAAANGVVRAFEYGR